MSTTNVCVLSVQEAARLEHFAIWPKCKEHKHVSKMLADEGVEKDLLRYIGGPDTKIAGRIHTMVVTLSEPVIWQPVPCCNYDGSKLQGMRIWGRPATA